MGAARAGVVVVALGGLGKCLGARQPLPWARYRAWMEMVRKPLATEEEWAAKFGDASHRRDTVL